MEILIIDLETTALRPEEGFIVEVGAVGLDTETGQKRVIMDYVVKESGITKEHFEKSWVANNTDLHSEQIRYAIDFKYLKPKLQRLLRNYKVTAFNKKFDFGFLRSRGLEIPEELPDPMLILKDIMKIPHDYYGFKYPSVEEAYEYLFDKPLKEKHRAADDALWEADIVFKLIEQGKFKINE